jgi:EAL domain-containing protein (putative c-di-GMP-specific phosphodiesterase class I)
MQLRAETLVEETLSALKSARVEGRQLEIELTETSVLDNPEHANEALATLRESGVRISIDDFGTGYTSLSLLADLPLDVVKIDRLFISAVENSERSRAIVGSIINMAHALGLRVVGEGVETNDQLEIMSDLGCDEVQGYLISRPQPADKVTEFLVHQRAKEQARLA